MIPPRTERRSTSESTKSPMASNRRARIELAISRVRAITLLQLVGRGAAHCLDLLKLADGRFGRILDLADDLGRPPGLLVVDPVVGIEDVAGLLGQVDEQVGVRVFLGDQPQHLVALRHAADDVAVADLEQVRLPLDRRLEVLPGVRGLPDLQGRGCFCGSAWALK